jgi:hypothetical protein
MPLFLVFFLFKEKILLVIQGEYPDCHKVSDLKNGGCSIIDTYKD